jgi:signal recognition particle subunit SRP19
MGKKKGGGVRIKQVGPNKAAKAMMNMSANPMEDLMIPPEEMVHLPPPPDRNCQIFWPIREYN